MPRQIRDIAQTVKTNILNPALTSNFYVEVPTPNGDDVGFKRFLNDNGVVWEQDKLNLLCSEATLPGSSLATHEITGDFHGVTERHAYRRQYDDRIDLTFYVNADSYLPILFFEIWMKWIVAESITASPTRGNTGSKNSNYYYRVKYPDDYVSDQGLKITKFERSTDGGKGKRGGELMYTFIRSYPISISSMPVSYDSSSLLKCTVSMTYIRYVVDKLEGKLPEEPTSQTSSNIDYSSIKFSDGFNAKNLYSPATQAILNGSQFNALNANLPAYDFNQSFSSDNKLTFSGSSFLSK